MREIHHNGHQKQKVGRIVQLDARVLDNTLIEIIHLQLQQFLKYLQNYLIRTNSNGNCWHQFFLDNAEMLESLIPLFYYLTPTFTGLLIR